AISRAKGAGDEAQVRLVARQGILLAVGMSLVFGVAGVAGAWPLGRLMGLEGEALALTASFLQVMFGGIGTIIVMMQLTAILRGYGNALATAAVLVLANVLNVAADPFLIFGWAGLPQMGLMGAAWATVGARTIGCGLALWLVWRLLAQGASGPSGQTAAGEATAAAGQMATTGHSATGEAA